MVAPVVRRCPPRLPHPTTTLLAVILLGTPLTVGGCAEEPGRRPSPQVRCDQFRASWDRAQNRLNQTEALETRERLAYGAVMEGCLVWRDALNQPQQATR